MPIGADAVVEIEATEMAAPSNGKPHVRIEKVRLRPHWLRRHRVLAPDPVVQAHVCVAAAGTSSSEANSSTNRDVARMLLLMCMDLSDLSGA